MHNQIKVRSLLRAGLKEVLTLSLAMDMLGLDKKNTLSLLKNLERLGYIESPSSSGYWRLSFRGRLHAYERPLRVYKVNTLVSRLSEFLKRVEEVNQGDLFTECINRVIVLSEHPIQNESNGIEILYSTTSKKLEYTECQRRERAFFKEYYAKHLSEVDEFYYPTMAIYRFLKAGSPALKLSRVAPEKIKDLRGTVIYKKE